MASPYDIGDERRLTGTFTDINGDVGNPTVTTFDITEPDGTTTTYVHGTDAELVRDSTGVFHVDWTITQAGRHFYRFKGTGALVAAEETNFNVRATNIV